MCKDTDILQEVFHNDYDNLMRFLETQFPTSLTFYGWLKTRLYWQKKNPGSNPFHICCPHGDIKNGFVFYGEIDSRTYMITIFVVNKNFSKLLPALLESKHIKWNQAFCVGINIEHSKTMENILSKKGFRVYSDISSKVWLLSVEQALSYTVEVPADMYLAPIKETDIPKVDSMWPLKFDGSLKNLTDLIELNSSVGLYLKEDDKLISWSIECEYSEIGVLHTVPEYRNKGLAQIVIKALSKKIAETKNLVLTYTVLGNTASEKLFEKLGFKHVCNDGFLEYDKVEL